MAGIIILCVLLALLGALRAFPTPQPLDFGIAIDSPNLWNFTPLWGEILNVAGLGLCAIVLFFINKNFSLIKTGQPLGASFFLPLCFSNLIVGGHWSATPVVTLIVLLIYACLFNSYKTRNATRSMFFVATCLSVGSMFEYSFIPIGLAAFAASFLMEAMRPKEFLAMGLGLIAPYWVAIGFGLVNPLELRLPHPVTIFAGNLTPEIFLTLTVAGIMALCAVILSLYNGLILYAGNTRVRRSLLVMNTFGVISAICMLLDVYNAHAYLGVCNIWVAMQLANLFALRDLRRGGLLFWLLQLVIFSLSMIYMLAA